MPFPAVNCHLLEVSPERAYELLAIRREAIIAKGGTPGKKAKATKKKAAAKQKAAGKKSTAKKKTATKKKAAAKQAPAKATAAKKPVITDVADDAIPSPPLT